MHNNNGLFVIEQAVISFLLYLDLCAGGQGLTKGNLGLRIVQGVAIHLQDLARCERSD